MRHTRNTTFLVVLAMVGSAGFSAAAASAAQAHAPLQVQALSLALDPDEPDVPEEPDPPNPLPDILANYTKCKPVSIDLGSRKAKVSVLNTSCVFGRDFVHKNQSTLCGSEPTRGWTKKFAVNGEIITLTLSKGTKRIRTDACSTLRLDSPD